VNRDPIRVTVALLLVASAVLFVVGSRIEHHGATAPASPSPSSFVQASPSVEPTGTAPLQSVAPATASDGGEGSVAHEAAEHAAPTPSTPVPTATAARARTPIAGAEGSASREAAERAAGAPNSERIFGVDVEQPVIVAFGAFIMVALAALALAWRRSSVLVAVALFASAFAVFDIREAMHQASEGRTSLLIVASVLACMHATVALLAGVSRRRRSSRPLDR